MKEHKARSAKEKKKPKGEPIPVLNRTLPNVGELRKLPVSPATVLREIGENFNRLRNESAFRAYRYAQEALLNNGHILVPAVISLDHFWGLVMQMEEHLKGAQRGSSTKSPEEALADWLNEEDRLQ